MLSVCLTANTYVRKLYESNKNNSSLKAMSFLITRHQGFGLRSASVRAEQLSCPEFNSPYINRKRKPPLLRVMAFFF